MGDTKMWNDLWLNLLAEGLGIIATVFVIDRLLKIREEKRWLPSKNLLYADLTKLIDRLFRETIPFELQERSRTVWCFGSAQVILGIDFKEKLIAVNYGIDRLLIEDRKFDAEILSRYQTQIHEKLNTSAHLMEPELLEKLMKLDGLLTSQSITTSDWENEIDKELFIMSFVGALATAGKIWWWLEEKADQRKTLEQLGQDFKEQITKLQKIKDDYIEETG